MTAKQNKPRVPKLRHHKATGQGYVVLNGIAKYLGRYGLPETLQNYHTLIAEWMAAGRELPVAPEEITVTELIDRYWDQYAQVRYRQRNGTATSSMHTTRQAFLALRELYGATKAARFGPLALRAVRQRFIDNGCSRSTVNGYTSRIRHLFKWGTGHELIPPSVHHGLSAVEGLRAGWSDAKESESVKPVPEAYINAVRPHVASQIWALIRLQLLTGARAGELVKLRAIDIDTTGKVWIALLREHKTAHHGRQRKIYLGPQAQDIVKPFMARRALDAYLFSPREGNAERKAIGATQRRRPKQAESPRETDRTIREQYTTDTYRRAIERACEAAGVPKWTPHRLRHNAATEIRRQFGIEAAQLLLGHAKADVTQIYAEVNEAKLVDVAMRIG